MRATAANYGIQLQLCILDGGFRPTLTLVVLFILRQPAHEVVTEASRVQRGVAVARGDG